MTDKIVIGLFCLTLGFMIGVFPMGQCDVRTAGPWGMSREEMELALKIMPAWRGKDGCQ